jgi:hypothetical protein
MEAEIEKKAHAAIMEWKMVWNECSGKPCGKEG